MSGEIPADLGDLASLQWLLLYGNALDGSIPPELGSLTSLQYLYLHNNQLDGSIPTQLGSLTSCLQRQCWTGRSLRLGQSALSDRWTIPSELGDA